MSITLIARRQQLAERTVAAFATNHGAALTPPTVTVVTRLDTRGRFTRSTNTIKLRFRGFLDDGDRTDAEIVGAVAHELGHWADPSFDRMCRGVGAAQWATLTAGVAAAAAAVLTTSAMWGTLAALLLIGSVTVGAPWVWRSEYRADTIAAEHVGAAPVLEFLHRLKPVRRHNYVWQFSHPAPVRRIERLRQHLAAGTIDLDTPAMHHILEQTKGLRP